MKATSLSINLWAKCNARCPFCISKSTWKTGVQGNQRLVQRVHLAFGYAKWHNVLITSNGEPTTVKDDMYTVIKRAKHRCFPIIELQSNGLLANPDELALQGVTTLAISIADTDPAESANIMHLPKTFNYYNVIARAHQAGLLVRVSLNLTNKTLLELKEYKRLEEYITSLKDLGVRQLTFRRLGWPTRVGRAGATKKWIQNNATGNNYADYNGLAQHVERQGTLLRKLSYGNMVYDLHGMSVTISTCMTDNTDPDEIRSLIFMPDGHLYHSWDSPGSILL
jgi:molybdenum cofactor biosynthesis enzyme MoaA